MGSFKRHSPPAAEAPGSHSRLRAAAARSLGSGEHAMRYELVRDVLLGYLSPILVESVLERALKARNLSPRTLTAEQLAELASHMMVGLRLFVREDRLPRLMLELADVLKHGD